jgi:hypothetical protein
MIRDRLLTRKVLQIAAVSALLASTVGCYTVRNADMFAARTPALAATQLADLSSDGMVVERLTVALDPSYDAYRIRVPGSRGTVVFFGGNGNEIAPVIKVFGPHTRAPEARPGVPELLVAGTGTSNRGIDPACGTSSG